MTAHACAARGALIGGAMQERLIANLAARLAVETPLGAFQLLDYLIVTSATVGAALQQLARYSRLTGAPYDVVPRESEDPIRVLYINREIPFSVEYGVTISLLHRVERRRAG